MLACWLIRVSEFLFLFIIFLTESFLLILIIRLSYRLKSSGLQRSLKIYIFEICGDFFCELVYVILYKCFMCEWEECDSLIIGCRVQYMSESKLIYCAFQIFVNK